MDIREALTQLDTFDDEHWTDDGAPRIKTVSDLVGRTVTRKEIIDAAPKFTRENTELSEPDQNEDPPHSDQPEKTSQSGLLQKFAESEPQTVQEFVEFLKTVPSDELHGLEALIADRHQAILEQKKRIEELEGLNKMALGHTRARIKKEIPDVSNQEAIQTYIKSQQEQRARKFAATNELLQNVDISTLDPRAPIDRAMARKTKRGGNRPLHPMR